MKKGGQNLRTQCASFLHSCVNVKRFTFVFGQLRRVDQNVQFEGHYVWLDLNSLHHTTLVHRFIDSQFLNCAHQHSQCPRFLLKCASCTSASKESPQTNFRASEGIYVTEIVVAKVCLCIGIALWRSCFLYQPYGVAGLMAWIGAYGWHMFQCSKCWSVRKSLKNCGFHFHAWMASSLSTTFCGHTLLFANASGIMCKGRTCGHSRAFFKKQSTKHLWWNVVVHTLHQGQPSFGCNDLSLLNMWKWKFFHGASCIPVSHATWPKVLQHCIA